MAKYFTSVYKNYYEKINNSNIVNNSNILNDKIMMLNNSINNYVDGIENSNWSETGKNSLISSYIPNVNSKLNEVKDNYLSIKKVTDFIGNDLFNLLKELKEKDDLYINIQNEVKNGVSSKKGELDRLDKELTELVNNIDRKLLQIRNNKFEEEVVASSITIDSNKIETHKNKDTLKKLKSLIYGETKDNDGSFIERLKNKVEENKEKRQNNIATSQNNEKEAMKEKAVEQKEEKISGNVSSMSLLGSNYNVINSAMSPVEYQSFAYDKGIRQNSNTERYSDYCLAFSYVHASNIYNNSTSDNAESAYNWKHAAEFYDYFNDNKTETLQVVYDQIMEGKPVILQVNGNKAGTSRHFVTVVGVKDGVTKSNVSEGDLLILDSWDAKLERMDESTSRFMTTGKETHKSYSGYYLRILK